MRTDPNRQTEVYPHTYLVSDVATSVFGDLVNAAPELGTRFEVEFEEQRALIGENGDVQLENVCGLWPGSDPQLAREVIVVSAHYDHVGRHGDDIYNGADDNGSGTCGLLAMAEMLAEYGPLRRSVMLMWVLQSEVRAVYMGSWWSAMEATQSSAPENMSTGTVTDPAAEAAPDPRAEPSVENQFVPVIGCHSA